MPEQRIFRYRLPITDRPTLSLPKGCRVLSVGPSRDQVHDLDLWAVVDPEAELVDVQFRVIGTGHPIEDGPELWGFVGTVPVADGQLIFHVFQVPDHSE